MAIINTNGSFGPTDTVTNTNLNEVANAATFNDPVDEETLELIITGSDSGKLRIKAGGVDTNQIADSAVTTAKIADSNVTKAKIEDVSNMKVLGNTSGSATAPQEVDILDEDDMSSDSATALATQQSIKAYFDEYALKEPTSGKTGTFDITTSWDDFDLSAAVGANKAMVVMEVYGGSNGRNILFRTKGSTFNFFGSANAGWGSSGAVVGSTDKGGIVVFVTDASGVVQKIAQGGSSTGISYNILAYQKLI
jgi:hypothetical protein